MQAFIRSWKTVALGGAAAAALVVGSFSPAMAQNGEGSTSEAQVVVGTFQQQQVIQPYQQHLRQRMQKIQQDMRSQQGNGQGQQQRRQQMMQARKKMKQEQQKIRKRYQSDLQKVMPKVAESAEVDLIVPSVTYKTDKVATKDITQQVSEQIKSLAPEVEQPTGGMMPGGAGQGGGQGQGQGAGQGQNQGGGQSPGQGGSQ